MVFPSTDGIILFLVGMFRVGGFSLFRSLVGSSRWIFSRQVVKVTPRSNCYEGMTKEQLLQLADVAELSVNEMIQLSSSLASINVKLPKLHQLIVRHIRATEQALLGTFLSTYYEANSIPSELLVFYIDWYKGGTHQELLISELLQERNKKFSNETEQYLHRRALEVNQNRLLRMFGDGFMDFSELLQFMRFYQEKADQEQLKMQLIRSYQGAESPDEAILYHYMTRHMNVPLEIRLPKWSDLPKSLCMLMELTQHTPAHNLRWRSCDR